MVFGTDYTSIINVSTYCVYVNRLGETVTLVTFMVRWQVIEKNGFEVLISDRREVGAGDIKGEGTGGFQEGRVSMRGGADTSGHPLGESY